MQRFFESLEYRRLLSVSPADAELDSSGETNAVDDSNEVHDDLSHATADCSTGASAGDNGGATTTSPPTLTSNLSRAAARLKNLVGSYTGVVRIPGVSHIRDVTMTITKQSRTGVFSGTMIPTLDTSIHIAVTGRVKPNNTFTISLKGTHSGGAIDGTGHGRIGRSLTASLVFVQSGQRFPGSMTATKA